MMNNHVANKFYQNDPADFVSTTTEAASTLECSLEIMQEIAQWLIKSGIGYNEFSSALKPLFYKAAIQEADRIEQKKTDSSLSLLAGLHRKDIRQYRLLEENHQTIDSDLEKNFASNIPTRVVAKWLEKKLPFRIATVGEQSFEQLVKEITTEKHPRSILLEMKRLELVSEQHGEITLQCFSSLDKVNQSLRQQCLSQNLTTHLKAGLFNIFDCEQYFLEQAISIDHLSLNSIEKLRVLSQILWDNLSHEFQIAAQQCIEKDRHDPNAQYAIQLGIYSHNTLKSQ
ncbi:hypothetical protein [Acinetobacter larvae]|uniref:Uncharacterized protein n=1 Tax=Acinetobacter larvae TaxID=1789224 RepID=A0A1B2LYB0_9GAMM|nr:hypothetical protein [Acinetobacter larvae]AOA57869.1 hypothetical protein BFG52_05555 [Acinetobacter larvae]